MAWRIIRLVALTASGALGTLRVVQAEYVQDWLAEDIESDGQKQAAWRTDPAKSAAGGAIGDIGTHAYNLAQFVTGQTPVTLSADLSSFVPGRRLDDNAHIMLRYGSGANGMLWATQVAVGNENGLRLRVYGDKGGLEVAIPVHAARRGLLRLTLQVCQQKYFEGIPNPLFALDNTYMMFGDGKKALIELIGVLKEEG